jgi:hypothetical protein
MEGVVLGPGEGEALFGGRILIKADFEQLCVTESHFHSARPGADPHFTGGMRIRSTCSKGSSPS